MDDFLKDIREQYERTLIAPTAKPSRPCYICPVGLVGAGKTTVLKMLCQYFPMVRISSDEVRKILKESGHGYEQLQEILVPLIEYHARKGESIAFDMDCSNPFTRENIERMAKETGAVIFWIHIDTPEDFILNKLKNHPPTWLANDPQVMINNYFAQKENRKQAGQEFDYFFTFDTSRDDLPKQVQKCVKKIESALLGGASTNVKVSP